MEPVIQVLMWSKETKNTNVYQNIVEDSVVPTLYINKAIPKQEVIQVTIQPVQLEE